MDSVVLTIGEVSDWLKVRPLTIRRQWIRGEFPAPINIGRVIRWRESDVQRWLKEQPASSRYSQKVENHEITK